MKTFSTVVVDSWIQPFLQGHAGTDDQQYLLTVSTDSTARFDVQVLVHQDKTYALASQELAAHPSVADARSDSQFRRAVVELGFEFNGADQLFFYEEAGREELLTTPASAQVRRLSLDDQQSFDALIAAVSEDEADEAFVELDHWLVYGYFHQGQLVCASSAYPFSLAPNLADIGVLTHPEFRGHGFATHTVRTLAQSCFNEGKEPQYRCQLTNLPSMALAAKAGLSALGSWDVASK